MKLRIWVSQDSLVLNPCWLSVNKPLSSSRDMMFLVMCSRCVDVIDVRDIGLLLAGSYLSHFLKTGVVSAVRNCVRTWPVYGLLKYLC